MSELLALGTSHKTAPLALRERIALLDGGAEKLLEELTAHDSVAEAVALSTCNRTELYLVVSDPVEAESFVLGLLARRAALRPSELLEGMYSLRNCDAARHLYRVTSGLESMIVGEAEVQGQVKRAYELALSVRTTGPDDQQAVPGGAGDRQAGALGDGDLLGPGQRRDGGGRRRALGDRRPRQAARRDRRRRRDRRAHRPGAARPGRHHDVRRQPAARAGDRARRSASAARPARSTRCPASSSGRTSSSPRRPRRTRCSARRRSPR